jgi:iron-sulfur cluster assembly protein
MQIFSVTSAAAQEIERSMELGGADGMGLRIAATQAADGGIGYRMGFDERAPGDVLIQLRRVEILIASTDRMLLEGTTMDFVELETGKFDFIFLNPNDPHYRAPIAPDENAEAPVS